MRTRAVPQWVRIVRRLQQQPQLRLYRVVTMRSGQAVNAWRLWRTGEQDALPPFEDRPEVVRHRVARKLLQCGLLREVRRWTAEDLPDIVLAVEYKAIVYEPEQEKTPRPLTRRARRSHSGPDNRNDHLRNNSTTIRGKESRDGIMAGTGSLQEHP